VTHPAEAFLVAKPAGVTMDRRGFLTFAA